MKKIKKIEEYFDNLLEAFDNPLPIKWIDKDNILRGLFTVNDNIYQIVCANKGNNIWKYDFYFFDKNKDFKPELTGLEKDKFRVLPTVKVGMKYLYDSKDINAIVFGASDKSKGRKKIYEQFSKDFSTENNLEYYTKIYSDLTDNTDRQIFVLYKKEMDNDILAKTILEILEEEKFGR